jgi:AAA15 family ATPase/GTPase
LLSDTTKRILFNFGALETNENSVILMEEPEVHSFLFYTKLLAERISLSKSNIFIVTTHNPYFLETILDKVPKHELSVYLARARGMRSEYEAVDIDKMEEIIVKGADVFLELGGES